jgi:anti-sigma regulatory factor (Ser/Thr protein kinase)
MVNRIHLSLKASDRSYFAILKKEVRTLAVSAGFNERRLGEIDIVVAEIVTNLVKHAGGGQLLVKLLEEGGRQGIELVSMDSGPGMADISRMVADGVSTKNTLGNGLGAMKRLSDVFQVYSQKGWGTVILCRLFDEEPKKWAKTSKIDIRTAIIPKPGEEACGDGFSSIVTSNLVKVFLGDGLGHGPEAAKAVETAIAAFDGCAEESPQEIIRYLNEAVKKTRGLVGTVAVFNITEQRWQLCGVGNISARIHSNSGGKGYSSYNGIIGLNVPNTLKNHEAYWEPGQHLIMCSDGIKSRWDSFKYPAIVRYDMTILATAVLKDFARLTDDMSVAICKINL